MSPLNVQCRIYDVEFGADQAGRARCFVWAAIASGLRLSRCRLSLTLLSDGEWSCIGVDWQPTSATEFARPEIIQALTNAAAKLLYPVNFWPNEQLGNSATLSMNMKAILPEARGRVPISFRPSLLEIQTTDWSRMWERIRQRVVFDPHFEVQGIAKHEVLVAIKNLERVFQASWVRANFRKGTGDAVPSMASELPHANPYWFPCHHLARSAHGSICIDAGWNYLVEIGLAIEALRSFHGIGRLVRQVARSPGTQHHLCVAAELFRDGRLLGLEPPTGSGSSTNDLLVETAGRRYAIEVKEFSSADPERRLVAELQEKSRQIPPRGSVFPVVVHAVLNERGEFSKEAESRFFAGVRALHGQIPNNITAVAAGRRFVDSSGGRVKRDLEVLAIASGMENPMSDDLNTIFRANYTDVRYPIFGVGSFFQFQREKSD